jgi:general secretion pathway protein H
MPHEASPHSSEAHRHRGTTLIELLIALAILGLVASATLPALGASIERQRFKGSAREIVTALRSARIEALRSRSETVLTLDVAERTYSIGQGPMHRLTSADRQEVALVTATIEQTSPTSGNIRFFADGSSTGGTVTFTLGSRVRVVTVDWLTGRIEARIQ